jgi:hypothetical protein
VRNKPYPINEILEALTLYNRGYTAQVRPDHAKAADIWKSADSVWWNGPDDPNVCVLLVRPVTAELWDGPASAAVAAFEFAKARLTGEKPNLGENRKVTLRM